MLNNGYSVVNQFIIVLNCIRLINLLFFFFTHSKVYSNAFFQMPIFQRDLSGYRLRNMFLNKYLRFSRHMRMKYACHSKLSGEFSSYTIILQNSRLCKSY